MPTSSPTARRRRPARRPAALHPATPADEAFDRIARDVGARPGVDRTRMFGSPGLKANGRVFAMLVKGALVVKLPAARVDALVGAGHGAYFDPGHGRLMKDWVAVPVERHASWAGLARDAHEAMAAPPATRRRRRPSP